MNLAALEMVDYVIIDENPTPIENIRQLQPDYFAKGYEYFAEGIPPRTQEEMEVLETYGGEMVFTPGDVVYSSSKLIELQPPQIAHRQAAEPDGVRGRRASTTCARRCAASAASASTSSATRSSIRTSTARLLGRPRQDPAFSVKHERTERFTGGAGDRGPHICRAPGPR